MASLMRELLVQKRASSVCHARKTKVELPTGMVKIRIFQFGPQGVSAEQRGTWGT